MRRYIITPVEDKDWTSLVEIQFRAFSTECFFHLLYGEDTHLNRSRCKERYLGQLRKQTNILWLKATDAHDPERKLLGAAKYDLNPAYTAGIPLKFNPDSMFWLDDVEEKKAAAATWELVTDRRAKHIKAPHIQLDLIFVAPEYQGKAIGNGLLDWGIELASHMMLPLWVESCFSAEGFYQQNGFWEVEKCMVTSENWAIQYIIMLKRPRSMQDGILMYDYCDRQGTW